VSGSNDSFVKQYDGKYEVIGNYRNLLRIMRRHSPDIVILADTNPSADIVVAVSRVCEQELVQFKVIPSYFKVLITGLRLETVSGVPILGLAPLQFERLHNRAFKRIMDIFGAIVGLILSVPVIVGFGLIIYYQSPGPVFYRQVRTGRRGKNFKIIKLRSMILSAEKSGAQWAKPNDQRRLPIGGFMRAWNLDEVPQFWNVLKGEMSLVGPRPERPELISTFQNTIPHYNARLISKPGMTGWAQVNGLRGDTDLVERVRFDLYYLENWSFLLDLQIMLQTFFSRKNAY
jgi:exopolysaccharide biosynthesis polyprenyl glycosylphosphotransferase